MPNTSRDKRSSFIPNPKSKLFEQVQEVMRFHHYSYGTEKTYLHVLQRICWKTITTSARSRTFSVTKMFPQP